MVAKPPLGDGMNRRPWTDEEKAVLVRMWPRATAAQVQLELPDRRLHAIYQMAQRLGLKKDPDWQAYRREVENRNLALGIHTRFRKGQVPANKGKRGNVHPNAQKHWFKPGQINNILPIGTELVNSDGYLVRKVNDIPKGGFRKNWVFVHRVLWAQHNGPIPTGHAVVFINGDKSDVRIENLTLKSRGGLMAQNTVHNYPEEVRAAIHASSRLTRVINNLKGKQRGTEEQPG